jgi:hypothetical protein
MKAPKKPKGGVHLDFKQAEVIGWKDLPILKGEKAYKEDETLNAQEKLTESKQKKRKPN